MAALKERVTVLEKENSALVAENAELKRNGYHAGTAGVTTRAETVPAATIPSVTVTGTPPTRRGSDAKDLLRKRLSVHGGAAAASAKAVADEVNAVDQGLTSEHPDWDKKYSDQHKRVYWKHKVCGRGKSACAWIPVISLACSAGVRKNRLDGSCVGRSGPEVLLLQCVCVSTRRVCCG